MNSYSKQLLLFIQGSTTDVYINILTHCINNESVQDVFFAVNDGDRAALSEAKEQIRLIRSRFEVLLNHDINNQSSEELIQFQSEYRKAYEKIPTPYQLESRIVKILFSKPELSISHIKRLFPDNASLLVDVTGCSKKVSTDVIASYLSSGIEHVRYFELDKQVYKNGWQKIYHCIRKDLPYYDYIDFSEPGTTISSFNRMRLQGRLIKILFLAILLLGALTVFLIEQHQENIARYASITLTGLTGIGVVIGFLNDSIGILSIVKRN